MNKRAIQKTIEINAPKEKVWDVLVEDKYNRIWYAEFSEGTYAETNWKPESKVIFKDSSGHGMIGKIMVNNFRNVLTIVYEGIARNEIEDYTSDEAMSIKGSIESYQMAEKDGITVLQIESDMPEEYFKELSAAWDNALQKIKELSEIQEQNRVA